MYRSKIHCLAAALVLLSPSLAWADLADALKIAGSVAIAFEMPVLAAALMLSGQVHRSRESLARLRAEKSRCQQGAAGPGAKEPQA